MLIMSCKKKNNWKGKGPTIIFLKSKYSFIFILNLDPICDRFAFIFDSKFLEDSLMMQGNTDIKFLMRKRRSALRVALALFMFIERMKKIGFF